MVEALCVPNGNGQTYPYPTMSGRVGASECELLMKLSSLVLMLLVGCVQSWAGQDDKHFVEFQQRGSTETYDLSTVHILQLGRFSIVSRSIDDADVMKLKLKVLDTLRTYCKQPNGKYLAPTDLLTLGPPDMEIENIEVQTVSWLVKVTLARA